MYAMFLRVFLMFLFHFIILVGLINAMGSLDVCSTPKKTTPQGHLLKEIWNRSNSAVLPRPPLNTTSQTTTTPSGKGEPTVVVSWAFNLGLNGHENKVVEDIFKERWESALRDTPHITLEVAHLNPFINTAVLVPISKSLQELGVLAERNTSHTVCDPDFVAHDHILLPYLLHLPLDSPKRFL